jgi:hypothetical protein
MSNEITANISVQLVNGTYKNAFQQSGQFNQNTLGEDSSIVTVTTTAANVTFPTVTTDGWLILANQDTTNYVDYGVNVSGSLVPFGRIKAGEFQVLRLHPGVVFMAQANTASVKLMYILWND